LPIKQNIKETFLPKGVPRTYKNKNIQIFWLYIKRRDKKTYINFGRKDKENITILLL